MSAVTIARAMSIQLEATTQGPLPLHLEDIVLGSHPSLGVEGRAALTDLLYKYNHVFPAPVTGDPVTGRTEAVQHEIETNGAQPVWCGPRHLALAGLRTEQECVRDMLEGGTN